jgi:hypothetical protein
LIYQAGLREGGSLPAPLLGQPRQCRAAGVMCQCRGRKHDAAGAEGRGGGGVTGACARHDAGAARAGARRDAAQHLEVGHIDEVRPCCGTLAVGFSGGCLVYTCAPAGSSSQARGRQTTIPRRHDQCSSSASSRWPHWAAAPTARPAHARSSRPQSNSALPQTTGCVAYGCMAIFVINDPSSTSSST